MELYGVRDSKHKILDDARRRIIRHLGQRFEGREWEEILLYVMASNRDLFGSTMMKFREKQMLKKFLSVIEIPPLGYLDFELRLDLEFYARFLALYISKLKRDWVKKDEDFSGRGPKKYYAECWTKRTLKTDANTRKI
jgi:hypothetical protein